MDEVLSLVGDMLMQEPDFLHLFLIVPGAGLHAGEPVLHPGQLLPGLCQIRQDRTAAPAVHIESGQRAVQTQGPLRGRHGRLPLRRLIAEDDGTEVFPGPGLCHRHGRQLPLAQGPAVDHSRDQAQLRHLDAVLQKADGGPGAVLAAVDGKGVPPVLLGLEPRVLKGPGVPEEVQKGLPQVLVDAAKRLAVHLPQERGLLFIAGRRGNVLQIRGGVKLPRVRQHPVPEPAAAAKGLLHQHGLLRGGMEAELDGGILFHPRASIR